MAPPAEQPSLIVLSGSMGGTVFVVDDSVDNILVGSDPTCRFALPGTGVDPIHARLLIDLEGMTVYDTNSPRGVYINNDRVNGEARLRNGDILWLGPPADDRSVKLQCRLPGVGVPPTLLAPDAIQPEPPVKLAPGDALMEPEPTFAMLPDDLQLSDLDPETDPGATIAPVPLRAPRLDPAPSPAPATRPGPAAAPVSLAAPAPGPRRERPAASAPRPRAPRAAPAPRRTTAPRGPRGLLIGGGLVAVAAVTMGGWWMLTRAPAVPESESVAPPSTAADVRPTPSPQIAAEPEGSPAAEVPVEEEVTLVSEAGSQAFTPGQTVVQTRSAKPDPGFSGRIEFTVNPPRVKPGDKYAVQIYLVNEGNKAIKVSDVSVTTNLNGAQSALSVVSKVKEVAFGQRAMIEEVTGVWPDEVGWWSAEVVVTANRGDSIRNTLTWE